LTALQKIWFKQMIRFHCRLLHTQRKLISQKIKTLPSNLTHLHRILSLSIFNYCLRLIKTSLRQWIKRLRQFNCLWYFLTALQKIWFKQMIRFHCRLLHTQRKLISQKIKTLPSNLTHLHQILSLSLFHYCLRLIKTSLRQLIKKLRELNCLRYLLTALHQILKLSLFHYCLRLIKTSLRQLIKRLRELNCLRYLLTALHQIIKLSLFHYCLRLIKTSLRQLIKRLRQFKSLHYLLTTLQMN